MKVWLVLNWFPGDPDPVDVIGLFSSESLAERACWSWKHVMKGFELDEDLGDERKMVNGWRCPQQELVFVGGKWKIGK